MNKHVVFAAIISGIVTWLFMYVDAKLFDDPKSKFTYFKGIVFTSSLVGLVVYFMTGHISKELPGINQSLMTSQPSLDVGQSGGMSSAIGDSFCGGMPPF